MKCNLKRHQDTEICKNKTLLTTMWDEDRKAHQEDIQYTYYKRYYESNKDKVISKQSENIECNIWNSLITRNKMNRHQEAEICKK